MSEDKKTPRATGGEPKKPWPMIWVVIAILVYAVIQMLALWLGN